MAYQPLIFTVPTNKGLAQSFLEGLRRRSELAEARFAKVDQGFHPNREPKCEIMESVRARPDRLCIVLGCTETDEAASVNDYVASLKTQLNALKYAGARNVHLVLPVFPYARQDRRAGSRSNRTSVGGSLLAQELEETCPHVTQLYTLEAHNKCMDGFFRRIPVEHIPGLRLFVSHIRERFQDQTRVLVYAPDKGGYERAGSFGTRLAAPVGFIDKRRQEENRPKALLSIGPSMQDRDVVLVDDMIDTAGTLKEAITMIRCEGARRVVAVAAHGLFNAPAMERIQSCGVEHVYVTNSVQPRKDVVDRPDLVTVVDAGDLLAEAVWRGVLGKSLTPLSRLAPEPTDDE